MKKSELVKAAKEVNTIIEPSIDTKMGVEELEAELLEASEAISEEDGLSKATMNVLNEIREKYADTDEEEDNGEEDEEFENEDEDDEGFDEEEEDGDEEPTIEIDEDEEPVDAEEDEEEDEEPEDAEDEEEEDDEEPVEEASAPKKGKGKSKPAKAEKPKKDTSKRDAIFSGNKTATRIEYFVELINEGRYSKKDLVELAAKKFPDATISALSTILSDGGNMKYCRFPVLLITDKEDGNIVKFTDQKCERGYPITTKIVALTSKKKEDMPPAKPGKKTGGKKK